MPEGWVMFKGAEFADEASGGCLTAGALHLRGKYKLAVGSNGSHCTWSKFGHSCSAWSLQTNLSLAKGPGKTPQGDQNWPLGELLRVGDCAARVLVARDGDLSQPLTRWGFLARVKTKKTRRCGGDPALMANYGDYKEKFTISKFWRPDEPGKGQ
jgi:hypothetical protein